MTPKDALDYAIRFCSGLLAGENLEDVKIRLLDDASKKLWMAAPWRWTIGEMEEVQLENDRQDYNLTGQYTDMYYPISAYLLIGDEKKDLIVTGVLGQTSRVLGEPFQFVYLSGSPNKIRVFPVPSGYSSAPVMKAVYKRKHTLITTQNYNQEGSAGCPDEWFWVYQEIVLLKAYQFSNDPRLGSVTIGPNGTAYTGQYAVVESAVAEMRMREKKYLASLGAEVVHA